MRVCDRRCRRARCRVCRCICAGRYHGREGAERFARDFAESGDPGLVIRANDLRRMGIEPDAAFIAPQLGRRRPVRRAARRARTGQAELPFGPSRRRPG